MLAEIEKEQKEETAKKLLKIKEEGKKKREKESEETIHAFSSSAFPVEENETITKLQTQISENDKKIEEQEINRIESKVSSVIEKPNYDFVEELSESQKQKVYKISAEEKAPAPKPQVSKIAKFVLPILIAIFGVWGVVNIAQIDHVAGEIEQVTSDYELNLISYLKNLTSLDATNSENMENLFETIPDESVPPEEVGEQSNWFDRICNFLGGLFGG